MALTKKSVKKFVLDFFVCLFFVTFIRWYFFEISTVPSGSMEKTINPKDYILVSKLHYGQRVVMTPLQIPLTHQKTHIFGIKSYLDWIKLPYIRLFGFSKIKRKDIVVFNTPCDVNLPLDLRTFYVKRCFGLPGEEIKVKEGNIIIKKNSDESVIEKSEKSISHFVLRSNSFLSTSWFTKENINKIYDIEHNVYLVELNRKQENEIRKKYNNIILELREYDPSDEGMFIKNFEGYRDINNWGPVFVPYKGFKIKIEEESLKKYGYTIVHYDCNKKCKIINNELYVDDEKVEEYTFEKDYFFMMGDNCYCSLDSRFWGFVPEDHIYGKVILIFNFYILMLFLLLLFVLFYIFLKIKKNLCRQ